MEIQDLIGMASEWATRNNQEIRVTVDNFGAPNATVHVCVEPAAKPYAAAEINLAYAEGAPISQASPVNECAPPAFDQPVRSMVPYMGEEVHLKGRIVELHHEESGTSAMVELSCDADFPSYRVVVAEDRLIRY